MNANTVIMLAGFIVLALVTWFTHGYQGLLQGAREGVNTLGSVWPLLLLGLGIAGFLQVIIPHDLISSSLGPASGPKGYLIGWAVGAIMPGAPYAILPVVASLLRSGAGIGPIMTMVLTTSVGVGLTKIPLEVAFVGWRFSVLRIAVCFLVPFLGGLLASYLVQRLGFLPDIVVK